LAHPASTKQDLYSSGMYAKQGYYVKLPCGLPPHRPYHGRPLSRANIASCQRAFTKLL
jgi:hypothetical protein